MNQFRLVSWIVASLSNVTLHAGPAAAPVSGWLVLIGGVLGLWVVIGGGVVIADRFLRRVLGNQ